MCDKSQSKSFLKYDTLQTASENLTIFTTLVHLWTKMNQLDFEFKRSKFSLHETKYRQGHLYIIGLAKAYWQMARHWGPSCVIPCTSCTKLTSSLLPHQ